MRATYESAYFIITKWLSAKHGVKVVLVAAKRKEEREEGGEIEKKETKHIWRYEVLRRYAKNDGI